MTSRPSEFLVVGQKVLDEVKSKAPEGMRNAVLELLIELQSDPYPSAGRRNVSEIKGCDVKHLYVAWCRDAQIVYRVAQDQPVILLVGVYWFGPSSDPSDGEDGDGFEFLLAA